MVKHTHKTKRVLLNARIWLFREVPGFGNRNFLEQCLTYSYPQLSV